MPRLRAASISVLLALALLLVPVASARTPIAPPAYDPAALLAIQPGLREEIARMLAGAEITNEARAAAERLIKAAS